jgi:ABC-type multidrug transport system ATPase subunit
VFDIRYSSQGSSTESTHLNSSGISITTTSLAKRYNREWVFRKLSYTFEAGKTYAITGPNGSGKSTLLQILWGQMPQTFGTIQYSSDGKDIPAEEIFQHCVIATPYMDLIDEFTLKEQLKFHFNLRKSRGLSIDEMIEKMYLTEARDKPIANFSSGMRQRVKLGLAFFTRADLIFFDEPGTNLDHRAFDWYLENLHAIPHENLVVIASNQPSEYPSNAQKIDIMTHK